MSQVTQDVHIVPVGAEFDRAVLPFLSQKHRPPFYHAHRIHLVASNTSHAQEFVARADRALRPVARVQRHLVDRVDARSGRLVEFELVLEVLSRLLVRELGAGHRVHINLSTGTKLISIAAGLAAMAYLRPGRGSTYYVLPASYSRSEEEFGLHGVMKGPIDVQEIQLVPLRLPEPLQLRVLAFLGRRETGTAEYRELLQFLAGIGGGGYELRRSPVPRVMRDRTNTVTTRMVRTLLHPLVRDGLLEIRDVGRRREARITAQGRLYASLSALDPEGLKAPL